MKAHAAWPEVTLASTVGRVEPGAEAITADRASLNLKTGGRLEFERSTRVAEFRVSRPLSADELVHPFLALPAAVMAHWMGRLSFHAGGVLGGGGVWAIAGDRGAGKSSLLAWLAREGADVVADDVLVLAGERAFAGPRSIDLREEAAERLGVGDALGVVGARPRWRLALPPIGSELTFRGWVFLGWGDRVAAEAIPPSQRMDALLRALTLRIGPSDPAGLLALATRPAWILRRPKDWSRLAETGQALLALVDG